METGDEIPNLTHMTSLLCLKLNVKEPNILLNQPDLMNSWLRKCTRLEDLTLILSDDLCVPMHWPATLTALYMDGFIGIPTNQPIYRLGSLDLHTGPQGLSAPVLSAAHAHVIFHPDVVLQHLSISSQIFTPDCYDIIMEPLTRLKVRTIVLVCLCFFFLR